MEFLFPEYRLDWFGAGPSSPNKTGALLAILFVVSWWPALRYSWGFWLSLSWAFVAAGLLLQTESRGALVASFAGSAILFSVGRCWRTLASTFAEAPADRKASRYVLTLRGLWLLVALSVLVLYSHKLGVNDRMAAMTSGQDGSSNVRVALYSAGMKMIAAAPFGWGHGEAGNAYAQWYQEIGDSRSYLSLVNSHLTWMADYGMLFQFIYIAGWCCALLLCWPVPQTPLRAVALAAWVTLGLCGFFSSVLTLPWLWIIPSVLLIFCLLQSYRSQFWPTKRQLRFASFIVCAGLIGLQVTAHVFARDSRLYVSSSRIEIGERPEAVAILQPDRQIIGDKYGHTLREYLDEVGGFTVLRRATTEEDLSQFDTIILNGGTALPELGDYDGHIVWMNPPAGIDKVALETLGEQSLTIIVGSLGDWRRSRVWQSLVDENPNWNLTELRGVADFIPNWPRYLAANETEGQ